MKLIDKAVEKSYRDYLQDYISDICLIRCIDVKFKNYKYGFEVSIKEKEYKDNLYKTIGYLKKSSYVYYLTHLEDIRRNTNKEIFEYRDIHDYCYEDL